MNSIKFIEKPLVECTKEDLETRVPKESNHRYGCKWKNKDIVLIPQ